MIVIYNIVTIWSVSIPYASSGLVPGTRVHGYVLSLAIYKVS